MVTLSPNVDAQPGDVAEHMLGTYFGLRLLLMLVALLFPPLMVGGGYWHGVPLQNSLSAYYHAPCGGGECGQVMRDFFVGLLFAVGAALYAYKGFSQFENVLLNLAGLFAVGVAVFPEGRGDAGFDATLHGVCAVAFFLCIGAVCLFASKHTLTLIENPEKRERYRRTYKGLALAMVLVPLATWAVSALAAYTSWKLVLEWVAIYVFAAYWIVKTREMRMTAAERRAQRCEMHLSDGIGVANKT
jgi:hypothetical membrane protein